MYFGMRSCIFIFLVSFSNTAAFFEPTIAGIGVVGAAIGSAFWYSRGSPCYSDTKEKAVDVARNLSKTLTDGIFGQHLVEKLVVPGIKSHLAQSQPSKALVLSFHGLPGTGKNYVARFIAESMYPDQGMASPHVHHIIAGLKFPFVSQSELYRSQVQELITSSIASCPRSLVIDGIKPFIDYHESINGQDYRKAIFIFLSNTGGKQITSFIHELWSYGSRREDILYEDLENLIVRGAFNEDGGLQSSNIIEQHLVDHYRRHVRMCIEKEAKDRVYGLLESEKNKILNSLQYWPDAKSGIYSTSGCKRIAKKLDLILG
ncbi:Torsin-1B [Caligus rogercresseyi]|uniref:Torsin-1B n=1 Tax=Caligus rogercresseyi TaxID=217165 RepID=A0A7T8HGS0_CALRO|nr:Torsin-1B [Caligus rogercresseyi]